MLDHFVNLGFIFHRAQSIECCADYLTVEIVFIVAELAVLSPVVGDELYTKRLVFRTDAFSNLADISEIDLPRFVRCDFHDEVRAEQSVRTMISRSVEECRVESLVLVAASMYMA